MFWAAKLNFRGALGYLGGFNLVDNQMGGLYHRFQGQKCSRSAHLELIWEIPVKDMLDAYDSIFAEVMPGDGRKYILPGVIALLEDLRKADAVLALYTGDSRVVAESICRAAGLTGYFRKSLYGTEVAARADMVRQAIKWAERETGRKFQGKDIVITGDSLRDIECGKQFKAVTIAVATGSHTAAVLRAAQPDFLFTDLADTEKVLRAVLGQKRAISRPGRTA